MKSLEKFSPGILKNIDWITPFKDAYKNIKNDLSKIKSENEKSPAYVEASNLIVTRLCAGTPFSLARIPYKEK